MCKFTLGDPLRMLFNHQLADSVTRQLVMLCLANNIAETTTKNCQMEITFTITHTAWV